MYIQPLHSGSINSGDAIACDTGRGFFSHVVPNPCSWLYTEPTFRPTAVAIFSHLLFVGGARRRWDVSARKRRLWRANENNCEVSVRARKPGANQLMNFTYGTYTRGASTRNEGLAKLHEKTWRERRGIRYSCVSTRVYAPAQIRAISEAVFHGLSRKRTSAHRPLLRHCNINLHPVFSRQRCGGAADRRCLKYWGNSWRGWGIPYETCDYY
jgi:hypothetical protein